MLRCYTAAIIFNLNVNHGPAFIVPGPGGTYFNCAAFGAVPTGNGLYGIIDQVQHDLLEPAGVAHETWHVFFDPGGDLYAAGVGGVFNKFEDFWNNRARIHSGVLDLFLSAEF